MYSKHYNANGTLELRTYPPTADNLVIFVCYAGLAGADAKVFTAVEYSYFQTLRPGDSTLHNAFVWLHLCHFGTDPVLGKNFLTKKCIGKGLESIRNVTVIRWSVDCGASQRCENIFMLSHLYCWLNTRDSVLLQRLDMFSHLWNSFPFSTEQCVSYFPNNTVQASSFALILILFDGCYRISLIFAFFQVVTGATL
ncbi:Homoserine kinase [Dirofilaria immitis]